MVLTNNCGILFSKRAENGFGYCNFIPVIFLTVFNVFVCSSISELSSASSSVSSLITTFFLRPLFFGSSFSFVSFTFIFFLPFFFSSTNKGFSSIITGISCSISSDNLIGKSKSDKDKDGNESDSPPFFILNPPFNISSSSNPKISNNSSIFSPASSSPMVVSLLSNDCSDKAVKWSNLISSISGALHKDVISLLFILVLDTS